MITEKDLLEAIAECQGQRNPNANTCIKLAAYYTILDHIHDSENDIGISNQNYSYGYSYDAPTVQEEVYESDSEFGGILKDLKTRDVMKIVDELMETLRILQPKLYTAVIKKLTALEE